MAPSLPSSRVSPGPRYASPLVIGSSAWFCRAAGGGHRLQRHAAADLFGIWHSPTLELRRRFFTSTSYISFLWSLALATITVTILLVICYPSPTGCPGSSGAGRRPDAAVHHSALRLEKCPPLWLVLFFIKSGVMSDAEVAVRHREWTAGSSPRGIIVLGMVYVYPRSCCFPMTLGVSMVPDQTRDAAFDLGASRWQVFREVDLPLSMPGIVIGVAHCRSCWRRRHHRGEGAGGQQVIPIRNHDIGRGLHLCAELAGRWARALSVLLMAVRSSSAYAGQAQFDGSAALRPRRPSGARLDGRSQQRCALALIWAWTLTLVVFMYLPAMCLLLASLTASRYFIFPSR